MATVRFCDRHFYFGKRVDARETGVLVEVAGVSVNLDLCGVCSDAIKSWRDVVRQAATEDGIEESAPSNRPQEPFRFLNSQSSA